MIIENYSFNKVAKTITFLDIRNPKIEKLAYIYDITANIVLYQGNVVGKRGTFNSNVLTLEFDTNIPAINDTDKLQIFYDSTLAETARSGFIAGSGIWFDDSSTPLEANASFIGISHDLTDVPSATAFNSPNTYANQFRVSAESDVAGILWLEASRDNINWRRIKSVDTIPVVGGGYYAEIIHNPSWRYIRVGYTNGPTDQTRFTLGSILTAI